MNNFLHRSGGVFDSPVLIDAAISRNCIYPRCISWYKKSKMAQIQYQPKNVRLGVIISYI